MRVRPQALVLAAVAGLLALLTAWWWAPPMLQPGTPQPLTAAPAGHAQVTTHAALTDRLPGRPDPTGFGTRSAADEPDPLLSPGLRDALEDMLLAAGDSADPATLKRRLEELVGRYFDAALATRALAMAERYVDYRVALGALHLAEDISRPEALRASLQARDALRHQYFDDAEHAALFADLEALDHYTLARLEIEQDPSLGARDRALALAQAEAGLGEPQRAARAYSQVQVAVASQTARFDAEGTDDRSRWSARSAQFGDGAATRLAALDDQERDWNRRLDAVASAQQMHAGDDVLARLRSQLFSPEEALRLDAALALRKAGEAANAGPNAQR